MSELSNQLAEIITKFNMKQIKKLKLLVLIRLLENMGEIDNDEIKILTISLYEKILVLDINNRKDLKDYKKSYRFLIKSLKKRYPHVAKSVMGSRGVLVAASSTLGSSHSSGSSGVVGAGVAYASNLKYDDCAKNKKKQ